SLLQAQVYEKVFSFTDARAATAINTGFYPLPALARGDDGNFYGTTTEGGSLGGDYGTVFQMTPDGVAKTLVEFTGNGTTNKGQRPQAALIQGTDGNFYGTTN